MEGTVHIILRDKQILFHALYLHKSEASGIADKGAFKSRRMAFPFQVLATFGNLQFTF